MSRTGAVYTAASMAGLVRFLHVSTDGVPKRRVPHVEVRVDGIDGDAQRNLEHHGGPDRVVCLLGLELIEALVAEGHPNFPGSTGENMTLSGLDWAQLAPGHRLSFSGGVVLELTDFAPPCRTIQASFEGHRYGRLGQAKYPGSSRIYARVRTPGRVVLGETVEVS